MTQLIGPDHPVFESPAYRQDLIVFNVLHRAIRPSAFLLASDGQDFVLGRNRTDLACWAWTRDNMPAQSLERMLELLEVHFAGREVRVTAKPPISEVVEHRFLQRGYSQQKRTGLIAYRLDALRPPGPVGETRPATPEDLNLLCDWSRAFHYDCFEEELTGDPRPVLEEAVAAGCMTLLYLDGRPAGFVRTTPMKDLPCCLVNSVYTHPDFRGRGGAKQAVATSITPYLQQGLYALLYADAANPRSNAAYQKIGFEAQGSVIETVMKKESYNT